MKRNKKILSILLAITMLLSIFFVTASASAPTSGTCGENITWTFDGSTLTISGTGKLKSIYNYEPSLRPYADSIITVVIEEGVTHIRSNAFSYCENLERVTIPVSLTKIDNYAFYANENLTFKDVYYEGTISQWYDVDIGEDPGFEHALDYVKVHYECKSGDFEYSVISETQKTIKITGYKVIPARIDQIEPYEVEIPSEIDGYTVTEIGDYAFYGKSKISAIELPSTVTKIGDYAFYNCSNLKKITISDNVTTIGDYAFYYCESLKGINIPDGVNSINDYAFYNCYNLKEITIPDNVTTIGDYAFYDCDSLKEFEIPDSVKTIGDYAFFNSNVLPTINLPASLISIGKVAFNVQAITVDSENPYFSSEDGVLFNKDKTTIIQYPVANNRESYIVPDSVKSIGYCAFYNCDGIKEIIIPESVKTISYHAFRDCDNLKEIIIPDSVTTIGKYAFYDCDNLETVIIPDGVTTIGDYAFDYCKNLSDVYFMGTEEQWNDISIGSNNSPLLNATIHFDHKNNHTPADGVTGVYTAPTCTEKGYTTYTCGICGMEYKDDYVNETGHIDSDKDEICDQCNKNLNPSTISPDTDFSDVSDISDIVSIFNIIIELFEKIFSLFGVLKV